MSYVPGTFYDSNDEERWFDKEEEDDSLSCKVQGHEWDDPNDTVRVCLLCDEVEDRRYLMGTPQETFWLNWKHFGLRRAIHRQLKRWCTRNYGREIKVWQNNPNRNNYNWVLWTVPWYGKYISKLESLTRNWGVKKRKS